MFVLGVGGCEKHTTWEAVPSFRSFTAEAVGEGGREMVVSQHPEPSTEPFLAGLSGEVWLDYSHFSPPERKKEERENTDRLCCQEMVADMAAVATATATRLGGR